MKRNNIFIVSLIFCFLSVSAEAQNNGQLGGVKETKQIAGVVGLEEQQVVMDSLLALEYDEENEEEIPSDSLYGEWNNDVLNPYQIKLDSIRDSFVVEINDVNDYVHPTENMVTSEYGYRWGRLHAGIDIRVKVGDSIRCAFDGKVRITRVGSRKKGYGYFVLVRHNNGLETLYAHLSKVLVQPNQEVKAGEVIALGGNTGRSTGPHLHFETRYQGHPMNPRNLIDFENYVVKSDKYMITKAESFKELKDILSHPRKYAQARTRGGVYRVKGGDTLGKIARKYHTTVKHLCRVNHLTQKSRLRIGQKIRF